MSGPDVDEVLNYLSIKFNKIFCDRDFVRCVIQDFQTILDNKNKVRVLVFPTLGPIYLKALRYTAKIFDLAVFNVTSASSKFKSVAICHKDHLKKTTQTKEEIMPESASKRKRPERQLYVPPAQRVSRLSAKHCDKKVVECEKKSNKETLSETSGDTDSVLSLSDVVNLEYFINSLPCEFQNTPKLCYQHHNCEFQRFLNFKKYSNSVEYESFIKVYDSLVLLQNVCWRLNELHLDLKTEVSFAYPIYDFNDIQIAPDKPLALLINTDVNNYEKSMPEMDFENIYKLECDMIRDELCSEIVDLSVIDSGHFSIVSVEDSDYLYECQEKHDPAICCENVRKQLVTKHVKKTDASATKNETVEDKETSNKTIERSAPGEIKKTREKNGTPKSNKDCVKNEINKKKKVTDNTHEQEKEIMRMTKEYINRKTRPIMKYVDDSNDTLRIDQNDSVNNWEDLFDDDGQIQEGLLTEIVEKVGTDITVVTATEDYTAYTNKPPEDLEHIVELYNFPPTLETHDLVQAFSDINSDAMYIKWVDDTHALLVLGSLSQAQKAMNMKNPLIKVRPMTAASAISMDVANKSDLKPAMKRPATNLQTARRLITTHLGTKSKLTKEQIAKERQDLKNAREMKRLLKQNERDAWEGNLRSSVN